jgi:DNA-binding NarL/FixJ family response regulator
LKRPSLVLAEDHVGVADALVNMLKEQFDVAGVVADGESLVELVNRIEPDAIVSDVFLNGLNGIAATINIRQRYPETPIVLMSFCDDPALQLAGRSAGASTFLPKLDACRDLVDVLRRLLNLNNPTSDLRSEET